jgi:uncharacterized protein (TIGR02996 family)
MTDAAPFPAPMSAAWASDGDNMFRAVLVAPEDDAPRLQYADWLEEHGQAERAEFIRVQCELARAPERPACDCDKKRPGSLCAADPWDLEYSEKMDRDRELLSRYWPEWGSVILEDGAAGWLGPDNPSIVGPFGSVSVEVRRGFVASVALPTAAFLELAAALFAAHPITEVRLVDRKPASGYPRSLGGDPLHDGRPFWLPHQYGDRGPPERHWLPRCLILRGGRERERVRFSDIRARYYDSTDEAEQDLSVACVAYGRQLADIPALT